MRAFTLIEILVSFTIMSFIIAGIYAVSHVVDVSWNIETALLDLQQQVRLAMDGMTREIRQTAPGDITVSSGGGRIDFQVPGASGTVGYYLQGGRIIREHPANTTKVIANEISSLNFCCLGGASCTDCSAASTVQVQIQGARTVKGQTTTFPLTGKIMLRNE